MTLMLQNQNALLSRLGGGSSASATDVLLGQGADQIIVSKSHDHWRKQMTENPDAIADQWYEEIRLEVGAQTGEPLTAPSYGERTLGEHWKGHAGLKRMWLMLSAIWWKPHMEDKSAAKAQTVQCFKALAKATKQNGSWAGAWEYTHLPDLNEFRGGVSMEEEASLSKYLREKAAVQKALADAVAAKKDKE